MSDALAFLTVAEMSARLGRRQVTSVDLVRASLERIERLDPQLHAFVTVMRETALAEAGAADREIAAGRRRGPLHGVPCAVKDLLSTRGTRTTWGAKPFEQQMIDEDAAVVRRLREAGAVLVGKLAMVELAGGMGYTIPGASLTGAARNPWDTSRWTCGSSSGSAAAVAAGLVPFAIGSETWGSIVCPSSFTGISGLRPTFGRVSRQGAMPLSWTMDKLGPMARTAADCETVLAAIGGHDPRDEWSAPEPAPARLPTASVKGLRVAFVRMDFAKFGEPEVEAAFMKALADLRAAGVVIDETTLPDLPFQEVAGILITAEVAAAFEELFEDGRIRQLADKDAPLAFAAARAVTSADYVKASRIRTVCQKAMAVFFERWDLLLAPGENFTAFAADRSFEDVAWNDPIGGMGNLCGLPAAAVPCGFGKGGLPAGLQVVGGAFEDARVLAFARLYQEITDWHTRRPPLA